MKIVVIGGSGLIGKKLVNNLRQHGHEVVAASPSSGVNALTGEGLAEALAALRSSSTWRTRLRSRTRQFWSSSRRRGRNLLAAEAAAGVGHHVALSVVGTDACWRAVTSARRWPRKT